MSGKHVTITPKTRVPLAIVGSAIGLAIYGTILYSNVMNALDASFTIRQAQQWLDDAREANPAIKWPRIPGKNTASAYREPPNAAISRKD